MQDARIVKVGLSKKQMSRMRNGHKVRVKPPMKGEGVSVIFNPANYSIITRTFSRNKGVDIALSPEEIMANQEASASPEMEGQGIFGKSFDRAVGKIIGKRARKVLYDTAREYLPEAQMALTGGLASGATALGVSQPWLAPYLPTAVAGLSALGSDYLADPSKYQSMFGSDKRKSAKTIASRYIQDRALESLNRELGTNMGNLSRASLEEAAANRARAELDAMAVRQQRRRRGLRYDESYTPPMDGQGLYTSSGRGLYASSRNRSGGAVGINSGFIQRQPQALQSQPFDVNFQFRHTLPPSFRVSGSGLSL